MNKPTLALALGAFLTVAINCQAGDGHLRYKEVAPVQPEKDWELTLSMPGWLAGMEGESGINGHITDINLDPGDVIRHYDMAVSFRTELSKGRWGVMGDLLYTSLSDGAGTETTNSGNAGRQSLHLANEVVVARLAGEGNAYAQD